MSTTTNSTSARRFKDRGVVSSSKITSSKSITPLSQKPTLGKSALKENPKSISGFSGPTQKPVTRPVPRLSTIDVDSRPKSRPRGRTPSPCDLRKTRVSNGEVSKGLIGSRVSDKKGFREMGQKIIVNGKENSNISGKFRDSNNLSNNFVVSSSNDFTRAINECVDDTCVKDVSFSGFDRLESSSKGSDKGVEKGRVGTKHTSKLHEKLAYLEGKVKRIASDIKKTKDMLDMNNTDASKMILSDIQEKISGIEKAMGNVIVDSDIGDVKSDRIGNKVVDPVKVLVKGLSSDDLEARLFPHRKLMRNRSSKVSDSGCLDYAANGLESNRGSGEEYLTNPVDEDAIASEFLASLNKMQPELGGTNKGISQITDKVQETDDAESSTAREVSDITAGKPNTELDLEADERLDEFDDQENKPAMIVEEDIKDISVPELKEIGRKTSTGGWFVSEGEAVLLAHDDGSCSFYDIANQEEKAEYRPPSGMSQNIWRDCWIIRAQGADGCSGKYVVAASAGNTIDSGFCSWDFYSKEVQAFHTEDYKTAQRVALGPLPDNLMYRRNALGGIMSSENQQWWYRPCGPLIVSTASCQRAVKVFDIRDGEQVMRWDLPKSVLAMDYSSPLQWRNRGKVVVAETEAISLWDVSSTNPQALSSVSTSGRTISALHVNNTDAELGGGVRQRVSSSEAEGNDGVFCTADSINVLDFRQPSGIGLKIPKIGVSFESVFSKGDSVFLGCSTVTSTTKNQVSSQVLQFSIRNQRIVNTYELPESNAHSHHRALTQVWGSSNLVMAVSGLGLFVFDTLKDDVLPSFALEYSSPQKVKEVIGSDDLYSPSFDYISSQVLLISRDRPAMWRHLS